MHIRVECGALQHINELYATGRARRLRRSGEPGHCCCCCAVPVSRCVRPRPGRSPCLHCPALAQAYKRLTDTHVRGMRGIQPGLRRPGNRPMSPCPVVEAPTERAGPVVAEDALK